MCRYVRTGVYITCAEYFAEMKKGKLENKKSVAGSQWIHCENGEDGDEICEILPPWTFAVMQDAGKEYSVTPVND